MAIRRLVARAGIAALLSLVTLVVSWGSGAQVASACDCSIPADDAAAVEGSDAAFTGTLVERIDPDPLLTSSDPVRYVFDVSLVHKGTIGSRVEVESAWASASCGAVISANSPMLVVTRAEGERLITAQCSGTRPITEIVGPPQIDGWPPAMSTAGVPERPDTDASAAPAARNGCDEGAAECEDQGGGADSTLGIVLAAVAILLATGLVAGLWLLRRSAR